MKRCRFNLNYLYLALITLFIGVLALFAIWFKDTREPFEDTRIVIQNGETKENITLWSDEETLYGFLPSYTDINSTYFSSDSKIKVDGQLYDGSVSLKDISLNTEHTIEKANSLFSTKRTFILMKSANIGTVFIDTETGSLDKLYADKEYGESATTEIYDADGNIEYEGSLKSISGRGNQTWNLAKRPWTITFNEDIELFGMDSATKWVLLSNFTEDSAGLRNMISLTYAKEIGLDYTSELCFVDLYLNDEYYGLFELAEKVEEGENRMDIGDLDAANEEATGNFYKLASNETYERSRGDGGYMTYSNITSPEDITGGYLIERNYGYKWENKTYRFMTSHYDHYNIREPSVVNEEEMRYIMDLVQSVENAIYAKDYIDEDTGKELSELIDLDSWVLKYMVEEVVKNQGAGATSCYFYTKKGDTKLYAGPAWDYDKSCGDMKLWNGTDGLTFSSWHNQSNSKFWTRLCNYKPFKEKVKEYYTAIGSKTITDIANNKVEEWKDTIYDSYQMNYKRWGHFENFMIASEVDELQAHPGDIEYSSQYLINWLNGRKEFLDKVWINDEKIWTVLIRSEYGVNLDYYCVEDGSVIELDNYGYDMNKYEWKNIDGWWAIGDGPITVNENMRLQLVEIEEDE